MKKTNTVCSLLALVGGIFNSYITANFFTDIYDQLFKNWTDEKTQYQYALQHEDTLVVELFIAGTITIKQGWDTNDIAVTLAKHYPSLETADAISLKKTVIGNTIKITVTHKDQNAAGSTADLTLLIPKNMTVSLNSQYGSIIAQQLMGNITASTKHGDIKFKEVSGTIIASTHQGKITIKESSGNIKATTEKGPITIEKSMHSVLASTGTGDINVSCLNVPSQCTINLNSKSGTINLKLPSPCNADVYAHTTKGQLTCEHFITTKPQTLQLNNKTWQRFKREISGILGSGEAKINLASTNSSINILMASQL